MLKRVCVYARVSKTSQSVERQISELEIEDVGKQAF